MQPMSALYLTPASISHLSLFLLTLVITLYLAGFSLRGGSPASRRQGRILFAFFTSLSLLSLFLFLENSLLPSDLPAFVWWESPILAVLLAALILFAYHFPSANPKQKIERWIVFVLSLAYIAWETEFAIRRILLLRTGHIHFRSPCMDYAMVAEFAWIIIIFIRSLVKNRKLQVVRNFALILLIPLCLGILEIFRGINATITLLYPILSAIGLLFVTFLFALNYLTSQPERTSIVAKVSGAVLTCVLAVFGSIAWLVTPAYAARYSAPVQSLDHRTIHFSPNGAGGYQVSEVPFRWETDLGQAVSLPEFGDEQLYNFHFPFLGQDYQRICVSQDAAISVGDCFISNDYQYHFTPLPAIFPMLVKLDNMNPRGGGVYIRQEPGRDIITWSRLPSYFHGDRFTIQAVLSSDGSFDFTYNGLPMMQFAFGEHPEATAWVVGIKPAKDPPGTADFTHLPLQIGPAGALQDMNLSFRTYINNFLRPLALAVLGSNLLFLVGTVTLLSFNLARPLHFLLKGVQNFNRGQREESIPVQSNDEIGFLTTSFNKLAGELNELIYSLEGRVAERTKELSVANESLRTEMEARLRAQEHVVEHQRAMATFEERERLARELHDGIGQVLGFLNVQAQSANDSLQSGDKLAASQKLDRVAEVAQEAHDDVRGYILGLKKESPAQKSPGVAGRLEEYCQHLSQAYGFQTVLYLPEELPTLPVVVETQLLYVVREALSNACAHSGQKQAEVTVMFDEATIKAVIEDHGTGFVEKAQEGHFGLGIMRERTEGLGGSLEVQAAAGSGTRVVVCLPRQIEGGSVSGLRLLLVDDHPLFLEGLTNLFRGRGMQVVGTAGDGLEAQEKARTLRPDVVLMDIEMPRCDGIEAARRIKAEMPDVKVVMLTVSGEERHLFEALQSGASGYLLKSLEASELTALLEELLRGEVSLSPSLAGRMLEAFTRHKAPTAQPPEISPQKEGKGALPAELTPRQMEILGLVAQGRQYKEIAMQLGLAEVTVKYHMGEILARLHLNSRREAVQVFQGGKLA
jgi:DNA-binding NarL/FixJ family response regulator/signal transduction histidine kinase